MVGQKVNARAMQDGFHDRACSLVGAGAGLGWLVLVFCERKILLAG